MNYLKELITGLPGDIIANLITAAITATLTFIISVRGKNPGAEANIHTDQSNGQRIFAPNNSGIIDASQHHTTTHNTVINKTTVNARDYGNQSPSDDTAGAMLLCVIGVVLSVAAALFITTLIPALTWLPVTSAVPALLIAAITLFKHWGSYTTRARTKTILTWLLTLVSGAQTFTYLHTSQNLTNPYSLFSIYHSTDVAVQPTDGWGTEFIHRATHLIFAGDRTLFLAWGIGLLTLAVLALIYIFLLQMLLGSLLFPATSNGRSFGRVLTSFNNSFVTAKWGSFVIFSLLTLVLPWITSQDGFTLVLDWGRAANEWLQSLIQTF